MDLSSSIPQHLPSEVILTLESNITDAGILLMYVCSTELIITNYETNFGQKISILQTCLANQ